MDVDEPSARDVATREDMPSKRYDPNNMLRSLVLGFGDTVSRRKS